MALIQRNAELQQSSHSLAGQRPRAEHRPGQSFFLARASCSLTDYHLDALEDLCRMGRVAEMVVVAAPSMEVAVVAVAGSQPIRS